MNKLSQDIIYCFIIKLKNNTSLFLTSFSSNIKVDNKNFRPDSGLMLKEAFLNDSAQNHIIITGIFEQNGINKAMNLLGAEVEILVYLDRQFVQFVTYYCNKFTAYDLNFIMRLEPETNKYQKSVISSFSKTCRANFGDAKCKIDKNLYTVEYNLIAAQDKRLMITAIKEENGYFNNGDVIFQDMVFQAKIINHFTDGQNLHISHVIIDRCVPATLIAALPKVIYLMSSCDKTFITCCNKFNNAVNFRGEPFIPEKNFLKLNQ